jgi:hypothetical protein
VKPAQRQAAKLESHKAPVSILVIDHAEKVSENWDTQDTGGKTTGATGAS